MWYWRIIQADFFLSIYSVSLFFLFSLSLSVSLVLLSLSLSIISLLISSLSSISLLSRFLSPSIFLYLSLFSHSSLSHLSSLTLLSLISLTCEYSHPSSASRSEICTTDAGYFFLCESEMTKPSRPSRRRICPSIPWNENRSSLTRSLSFDLDDLGSD
jgi:hypothetical protein